MNIIIGLIITSGCIFGSFMATGGEIEALFQPFELVIIGGAGIGSFIMANPMKIVKDSLKALGEAFKHKIPREREHLDILAVLYSLMRTCGQNRETKSRRISITHKSHSFSRMHQPS